MDKKPLKTTLSEKKDLVVNFAKQNTGKILAGAATAGLAVWGAYDSHKRDKRKEQKYNDHLDATLELQRDALGLYKESLTPNRPTSIPTE